MVFKVGELYLCVKVFEPMVFSTSSSLKTTLKTNLNTSSNTTAPVFTMSGSSYTYSTATKATIPVVPRITYSMNTTPPLWPKPELDTRFREEYFDTGEIYLVTGEPYSAWGMSLQKLVSLKTKATREVAFYDKPTGGMGEVWFLVEPVMGEGWFL